MAELTAEQKKALALAAARKRKADAEAPATLKGKVTPKGSSGVGSTNIQDASGQAIVPTGKWVTPGEGEPGIPIISDITRSLYPFEKNTQTGEMRPAVPKIIPQIIGGITDAVQLPSDVMTGKVDPMSDEGIARGVGFATTFAPGIKTPMSPKALGNVAAVEAKVGADAFDIPLTKGQASGELKALTKEENLRQVGGPASTVMRNFDETQRDRISQAAGKIESTVGRNAEQMPDTVGAAVKDWTAFQKDQAKSLYDIAFNGGLVVNKQALTEMPAFVRNSLADQNVIVDASITPSAMIALREIEDAGKLTGALRPEAPAAGTKTSEITGVSLQGLEQVRKRISALKGSTPEDMRAVAAIKRGFDEWLDDGVDSLLISGDDTALVALKKARAVTSGYKAITSPAAGDAVGQTLKKFLAQDLTAQEVANYLYGADVVSPSLNAPKLAARVRSMVGTESPAWQSVKAAAWQRLVKDLATAEPRTATMITKRIDNFVNAKGSSLARILFNEQERKLMTDFSTAVKRTITPRDATNPSRSAFTIAGMMDSIARVGAGLVGFHAGGFSGAAVGAIAYPVFKDMVRKGAAKAAIKGVKPLTPAVPIATSTPGAVLRGSSGVGRAEEQIQGAPVTAPENVVDLSA